MAHAGLKSLRLTIEQLFDSSPSFPEIKSLYEEVEQLLKLEEEVFRLRRQKSIFISHGVMEEYDRQFREATCKLEDVIDEYILSNLCLGDHQTISQEMLKQEIHSFIQKVQKIQEDIYPHVGFVEDAVPSIPSRADYGRMRSKMIGLEDDFIQIRDKLCDSSSSEPEIFTIFGMAGIGKTALAKRLCEDVLVRDRFDCSLFVSICEKYNLKEIYTSILAQLMVNCDINDECEIDESYIRGFLLNKRYLVVLDDIWDRDSFFNLYNWFPHQGNGSRIVLTTRIQDVACGAGEVYDVCFLNKEESWDLFCEEMFGNQLCPPELRKLGEKIAEKCEGLPLAIIMIADHLSKAEKTPKYWEEIAKDPLSIVADDEQVSKSLLLSYNRLTQVLKDCFLYMGVFPQSYEIPASKLFNLWAAEKFHDPRYGDIDLDKLVKNSLVLVSQRSSFYITKSCRVHSVYWHLCVREAAKENFFHIVGRDVNRFPPARKSHRRICIHNNVLFGIKPVIDSMESNSTVRSLLCTGPHHQYPVPICFRWRLLSVVDALTIRFYKFPIEVVELVLLRYLSLTYYGNLHDVSISKLRNLQFLIVHQHLSIIPLRGRSYLPMEIWEMQELRHLQVMGSDMPDPTSGAVLPNLLVLSDVSPRSCTEQVLNSIPNLEKLGIQIDSVDSLNFFDHLSNLSKLKFLKCNVIMNPNSMSRIVALPASFTKSLSSLMKLSLSGFRCPWEHMSIIGKIPYLAMLKLQNYAFQGPEWITDGKHFKQLEALVIEDTDLVHWEAKPGCFPNLLCLIIKHCYKLEDIPVEIITHAERLSIIEVVDPKTSVVDSLKKTVQHRNQVGNKELEVFIRSSWNDGTQVIRTCH